MNTKDLSHSDAEAWERIERYARNADSSVEELRQELIEEGVDPDELIQTVRRKIDRLLPNASNHPDTNNKEAVSNSGPANLLSLVRQETTDTPSKIAQNLGVTVPFLKSCGDFSDAVPKPCKDELIERTANVYSIDKYRVREVVEHPKHLQKAALRDSPYSNTNLTFEQIVKTSGMDEDSQRFWLQLAAEVLE
jgi:hypothetical protein